MKHVNLTVVFLSADLQAKSQFVLKVSYKNSHGFTHKLGCPILFISQRFIIWKCEFWPRFYHKDYVFTPAACASVSKLFQVLLQYFVHRTTVAVFTCNFIYRKLLVTAISLSMKLHICGFTFVHFATTRRILL